MEEKIRISILLEIYGNLLTEKQKEYMDCYYNQDLSLSEIADNENITRQAVNTILIKSKKKLEEYEEKMQILEKEKNIKEQIEQLEILDLDSRQNKIIQKIKEQIDF